MTSVFKHVEIEIVSVCNIGCMGCDRYIDVAPTGPMTVEQIRHFVDESLGLDWEWERIHILGGEPTLHRDLEAIVLELVRYRTRYPSCLLRVITNGNTNPKDYQPFFDANQIEVATVPKRHMPWKPEDIPYYFDNMHIAPKDKFPEAQEVGPCGIFGIRGCGIGLTKHGYYLCGAAASIARVSGIDCGVLHLKDLTLDAMMEQAKKLCCLCSHKDGFTTKLKDSFGEISPHFEKVFAEYKQSPPQLPLYGTDE